MSSSTTDDGLEIRELVDATEMQRVVMVFTQVWGSITPLVGTELLRAIQHSGGYVAAAYHADQIVGGSLGFLARHRGEDALHSHITGVLPGVRHTGLGRAMKLHQRSWAADHDLAWVTWTFDPLVRRNAWFNIRVLGADVDEYLVDFYGTMDDSINLGRDESDRLLMAWATSGPLPDRAAEDETAPSGSSLVATPEDIVVLRRTDRQAAVAWRRRVRQELSTPMADGASVVGFTRDGQYVVRR